MRPLFVAAICLLFARPVDAGKKDSVAVMPLRSASIEKPVVAALNNLLVVSLAVGLVFGRWGLPGRLQGRSVYWVPPLSIVYLLAGVVIMTLVSGLSISQVPHIIAGLFGGRPGLSLLLIHAAMMTAGAGLGWAIALAVTDRKRNTGKWETIGYVEQP